MLTRINIKGGELTYGQRIDLGELFAGGGTEVDKFKEAIRILHGVTPDFGNAAELRDSWEYYREITDGITFWADAEKRMLSYDPEPEELRAGIRELGDRIGVYGVITALAKDYGQDPDTILTWQYGKVFGILYADLETHKYQKRLHRQYEKNIRK